MLRHVIAHPAQPIGTMLGSPADENPFTAQYPSPQGEGCSPNTNEPAQLMSKATSGTISSTSTIGGPQPMSKATSGTISSTSSTSSIGGPQPTPQESCGASTSSTSSAAMVGQMTKMRVSLPTPVRGITRASKQHGCPASGDAARAALAKIGDSLGRGEIVFFTFNVSVKPESRTWSKEIGGEGPTP